MWSRSRSESGHACQLLSVEVEGKKLAVATEAEPGPPLFPALEVVRVNPTCIELDGSDLRITSAPPFSSGSMSDVVRLAAQELMNHGRWREMPRFEALRPSADQTKVDFIFASRTCAKPSARLGSRECPE